MRKLLSKLRTLEKQRKIKLTNCSISSKASLHEPCNLAEVSVDDYTYISPNSKISRTTIKKFCSIGPDLRCGWGLHPIHGISTAPMFYSTGKQNGTTLVKANKFEERKQIIIGNDVFIGMNVIILDGVTIGDGAVIGAGAVVSKDIPPYAVAVGIPIRVIKYRFSPDIIEQLLEVQWWNQDESVLQKVAEYCFDIESFLHEMKKVKVNA
ncbi:MAG: CatB-related O-acetyltransferase [Chitinophagaceae bacterium]